MRILIYIFLLSCFIYSCKQASNNYIHAYNKANVIDSILRYQQDSAVVRRKYKALFRKSPAFNRERIEEYKTYILISDKMKRNFGGKKSLTKLIVLLAPYGNSYKDYAYLYRKYDMSDEEVEVIVRQWKIGLNKTLIDSFSIAFKRNEIAAIDNLELSRINARKNARLLQWTLENYGFPSLNKIGFVGNDSVFMPIDNLLPNIVVVDTKRYPYFEKEILKYVKTGECPPRAYAAMVDSYNKTVLKQPTKYGFFFGFNENIDTVKVNHNRKQIGLPSLQHSLKIRNNSNK